MINCLFAWTGFDWRVRGVDLTSCQSWQTGLDAERERKTDGKEQERSEPSELINAHAINFTTQQHNHLLYVECIRESQFSPLTAVAYLCECTCGKYKHSTDRYCIAHADVLALSHLLDDIVLSIICAYCIVVHFNHH